MSATGHPTSPRGAYGIGFRGLEAVADLLVDVGAGAPVYDVAAEQAGAGVPVEVVGDDAATLRLRAGGRIEIDRLACTVRFAMPRPPRPDELVHPYLAPVAAVTNRWLGRESIHAGAFAVEGRALALIGARGAGKSSTLAALTAIGADALCDDLLVLDGDDVLAGPRSIDLRADAAQALGVGTGIGRTGARERWRAPAGAPPPRAVLAGWAFLTWGERVEARPLAAGERLARLLRQRALRLEPVAPEGMLSLAALPGWELSRPRGLDSLAATAQRLRDLTAEASPAGV